MSQKRRIGDIDNVLRYQRQTNRIGDVEYIFITCQVHISGEVLPVKREFAKVKN
jgi:hypothetical protein